MKLLLYQVDAFTDTLFGGNPAAVIPLQEWISDELMQQLALENNLSETVFFVPATATDNYDFHIRWFTPAAEINLCGHATLASALGIVPYTWLRQAHHPLSLFKRVAHHFPPGRYYQHGLPAWKPQPLKDFPAELAVCPLGLCLL